MNFKVFGTVSGTFLTCTIDNCHGLFFNDNIVDNGILHSFQKGGFIPLQPIFIDSCLVKV